MNRRSHAAMMAMGARCDVCPLRTCGSIPVPSETRRGAVAVIVAQHPGVEEDREGRPMVGPEGHKLMRTLNKSGVLRTHVNLTQVTACKFPEDVRPFLTRLKRKNKANGKKEGDDGFIPSPFDACMPRLAHELRQWGIADVITLGGHAAMQMIPEKDKPSIMKTRGHKYDIDWVGFPIRLYPTMAPSYVMRQLRWSHVFDQDIKHAFAWFRGADGWKNPVFVNTHKDEQGEPIRVDGQLQFYTPTVDEVEAYLTGVHPAWGGVRPKWMVYDLETDGVKTGLTNIRCIGVGTGEHVMIIPILSCTPPYQRRFYTPWETVRLDKVIRAWALDETIMKVGHFAAMFDRLMMEDAYGVAPTPMTDTVLIHKSIDAELPHSLQFCASLYVIVHNWKLKDHGVGEERDPVLWEYCAIDIATNGRILVPMVVEANKRDQLRGRIPGNSALSAAVSRDACTRDHALQSVAVGMHRVGMYVDQKARMEREIECVGPWKAPNGDKYPSGRVGFWRERCHNLLTACGVDTSAFEAAGVEDDDEGDSDEMEAFLTAADAMQLKDGMFNPGSPLQVRKLFVDVWDLPEPNDLGKRDMYTETGERRTGKAVLQAYLTDRRLTRQQRTVMHACFMYRKWAKRYGSEVRPSRYAPGVKKPKCNVWEDGRIHSRWNSGGTLVGRYSASGPNVQTFTPWFKPVMSVQPGNDMVGADVDQFHLRIIAALWNVPSLLEVFANPKLCPHTVFAEVVLGDVFRQAPGYLGYGIKPTDKKSLAFRFRNMAKTLRYAGAYGARPPTIYRILRSTTDDDGRLIMPKLEIDFVRVMHDNWMQAEPEWEAAWNRNLALFKRQGFLESPILKRRRYFLDQKDTDIYNWEILSCEGDIFGEITQRIVDRIPFMKWGPGTGLINQCHDALYVECPKSESLEVQRIMNECMEVDIPGWPVRITGAADIGPNMSKVA